ncbi:ankyrin repeat domain-containing protein [Rhodococcus sp. HNM0563]|uniref:ankyrin repeat domain-containing protein n=1 Tax=unclassified Rhodococcus (in: high G+C Gram-positive bacteria) TaxID=192944 RepID=UPI00146CBF6E|nr:MULTISPECIES: ankyrin repeat domain-containing protein [unclassified Rhodococcus (in: high G+C Gram-positive bacteria)]MCK0091286.1 ankyrin repeat domain-containing protein [Rhodococcus sp. F64268]NLU63844.1 ankyrin repeat domain-containing protein [Rhodococcus sp. HNM0563]
MADDQIDPRIQEIAQRCFDAARAGDSETLATYIEAGVPANLTNGAGDTLVMLASYRGNAAAVRVLVDHGADVNRANDRGQTPLAGAVFKGEEEVVRILTEAGADPMGGQPTAVDAAKMFGREDYLQLWQR